VLGFTGRERHQRLVERAGVDRETEAEATRTPKSLPSVYSAVLIVLSLPPAANGPSAASSAPLAARTERLEAQLVQAAPVPLAVRAELERQAQPGFARLARTAAPTTTGSAQPPPVSPPAAAYDSEHHLRGSSAAAPGSAGSAPRRVAVEQLARQTRGTRDRPRP
jgi:hypothetical protein